MSDTLSTRLIWEGDGLHLYGKGKAIVTIVADGRWPNMWRARLPDGRLTDMANRTRAKDAAVSIALSILNSGKRTAGAKNAAGRQSSEAERSVRSLNGEIVYRLRRSIEIADEDREAQS
jgi:hypothetical protein